MTLHDTRMKMHEKLAVIYDILLQKGLCPDKPDDMDISCSHYGEIIDIIPSGDLYILNCIVLVEDIDDDLLVKINELMQRYPDIQITAIEHEGNIMLLFKGGVKADIQESKRFAGLMDTRMDSLHRSVRDFRDSHGLMFHKSEDREAETQEISDAIKEAGIFKETDSESDTVYLEYEDTTFAFSRHFWGFELYTLFSVAASDVNDSLYSRIFECMSESICKCTVVDDGEPYLRISTEIYYTDWSDSQKLVDNLKYAAGSINHFAGLIASFLNQEDSDEEPSEKTAPDACENVIHKNEENSKKAFEILKSHGYMPEIKDDNTLFIRDAEYTLYVSFFATNDIDGGIRYMYSISCPVSLDRDYNSDILKQAAFSSEEYIGKCIALKNEVYFIVSGEFVEEPELLLTQFYVQLYHIRNISRQFNETLEGISTSAEKTAETIFKYLNEAGFADGEPETSIVAYKFGDYVRFVSAEDTGYIVSAYTVASEEKNHKMEDETIVAQQLMLDAEDLINIYRSEDEDGHMMVFSMFFDELPTDNAETFINVLKEITGKIDNYENEFIRRLAELESMN